MVWRQWELIVSLSTQQVWLTGGGDDHGRGGVCVRQPHIPQVSRACEEPGWVWMLCPGAQCREYPSSSSFHCLLMHICTAPLQLKPTLQVCAGLHQPQKQGDGGGQIRAVSTPRLNQLC